MTRMLATAAMALLANAAGLLLAMILINGFSIDFTAFVMAVVLFTLAAVIADPLLTRISQNSLPALAGGVALVTTFVGLFLTSLLVDGMQTGGMVNLLLATLVVWLGALVAGTILAKFVLVKYLAHPKA
jgi:hypothetical protein